MKPPLVLVMILGLHGLGCVSGWQFAVGAQHKDCEFLELPGATTRQCGGPYSDKELQRYFRAFEEIWKEQSFMPQNASLLHASIQMLDISWQPNIFGQPRKEGSKYLEGLTYSIENGRQRVYCVVRAKLPDTSLGHELIHVGYGALKGDMRGDHFGAGNDWPDDQTGFLKKVAKRYEELEKLDEGTRRISYN